jgi:acetyltransferase-like isoleucine patch superfamily enzyme/dTDP-4-dehydrorhamnose 3,5-epimerase-like enzyme
VSEKLSSERVVEGSDEVFLHPQALCESASVGAGTRVWAFAHILSGAKVGRDCNICDGVFVENDVVVGDRVTVKCGVQLWDGVRLEDDVFVGPNATFTNDRFPRSRAHPERYPETIVRRGASIGANATILPGLEIGANAMVGAGAVVTRSVPNNAIVKGNPARIAGYVGAGSDRSPDLADEVDAVAASRVDGVQVIRFPRITDMRGSLLATTYSDDLPFTPQRHFLVFDVPSIEVRGEHAHRSCHQFLTCVSGSVRVLADDGRVRQEFLLDRPDVGIHIPPMIWGTQYEYTHGSVLLVLASHPYDSDDYIRTYEEFRELRGITA